MKKAVDMSCPFTVGCRLC